MQTEAFRVLLSVTSCVCERKIASQSTATPGGHASTMNWKFCRAGAHRSILISFRAISIATERAAERALYHKPNYSTVPYAMLSRTCALLFSGFDSFAFLNACCAAGIQSAYGKLACTLQPLPRLPSTLRLSKNSARFEVTCKIFDVGGAQAPQKST